MFENLLRRSATFGGVDFYAANTGRQWIATGFLAGSHVTGSDEAISATQLNSSHYYQRPDADYLEYDATRTSLDGHIAEVALAKNGEWYGSIAMKQVSPPSTDNDRFTRGGPIARNPSAWYMSVNGGSDNRKPVYANGFTQYTRDESGGDNIQAQVTATWRPASNLNLSFGPNFNKNRSTAQRG